MPKISIITVALNSEKTIESTIKSVQNQSYKDFEYILVDGNSKDKTLEIAGQYKDFVTKWISEPDKNVYDAMNKGVLLAQGDYILFLNANDALYDKNTLEKMAMHMKGEDILFFDSLVDQKIVKPDYKKRSNLYKGLASISSKLFKREFLENMGGFDTRFKILSGFEFDLRAILKNNAKINYISETVSKTEKNTEKTLSPKYMRRFTKEKTALRKSYFSAFENIVYKFLPIT